jgi:SAM-dependent methyltransferase
MNREALVRSWKAEEEIAHIHGWDFSHLDGRLRETEDLPWNYRREILERLQPDWKLMDMDTGGGEFLLSLGHPCRHTAATENFPPNVELCREKLIPMGIDFRQADAGKKLPFEDNSFHMVINRHGDFCPEEIFRVLKPGGWFVTQQVGARNDRELVELLCGDIPLPYPEQELEITKDKLTAAGFEIRGAMEAFRPIELLDVGALVWFARIIRWEFPGFSVDTHMEGLLRAQEVLERQGKIAGSTHRFFLAAVKPDK